MTYYIKIAPKIKYYDSSVGKLNHAEVFTSATTIAAFRSVFSFVVILSDSKFKGTTVKSMEELMDSKLINQVPKFSTVRHCLESMGLYH